MNHKTTLIIISLIFSLNRALSSDDSIEPKNVQVSWIEGKDVSIEGTTALIDTYKGIVKLNVIEYDAEKDLYLVECTQFDGKLFPKP